MSQEQRQQATREEKLVPSADRVKISTTNVRIEPTMPQKEETFQVVLDIIKASPCFKAFTITTDVPEIYKQQFWFPIKKTKKTPFYEFGLAQKKSSVDVELFKKILDISTRVPNEDFVAPPSEEDLLAFLIELGYKGPLDHLARMFVDHMHQPWRTLATIINKSLSRKTSSNDRLRQSRVAILWEEQLVAATMQALKANKNSSKSQPNTGGSGEGTGIIPGVPDESTVIFTTSSEGTGTKPGVVDKVSTDEEEEKQDDQDNDDDGSIDIENTDDEEETDDEFVHGDEYVHDNVDKEMKDAKVAETRKDNEETTNAEKTDAEKTEVTKGDLETTKKSAGYRDQFTIGHSNPTRVTPVTTLPPPPSVTNITLLLQQQTTPIPTPPITIAAPAATTVPDLFPTIVQRVSELENDVQELKQVDHVTLFITNYSIFDLTMTKTCQEESSQTRIRDD
ncbi:hypothetical protein Tco_1469179 [Tanacetum coccineum]